jgi:hypothetical protein
MQRVKHAWYYGFFLQTFSFFFDICRLFYEKTLYYGFDFVWAERRLTLTLVYTFILFQSGLWVLMSYAVEEGIINNVSLYVLDQLWWSKWCSGVYTNWILDNSSYWGFLRVLLRIFCRLFVVFFESFEGFFEDFCGFFLFIFEMVSLSHVLWC